MFLQDREIHAALFRCIQAAIAGSSHPAWSKPTVRPVVHPVFVISRGWRHSKAKDRTNYAKIGFSTFDPSISVQECRKL